MHATPDNTGQKLVVSGRAPSTADARGSAQDAVVSKEPDTHQQPVRDRDWKRLAWSSLDKFISHAAESCGDEVGPALAKLCTFGARCVAAYFFLRSGLVPDPAHLAEIVRAAL